MPGHIQCTGTVNFNIVLLNNEIENYIINNKTHILAQTKYF